MASEQIKIEINAVDNASGVLNKVSNNVSGFQDKMAGAVGASLKFGAAMAGVGAGLGVLAKQGITFAATLETAERGLAALLGSAEKASKTVDRVKQEAARTPFEIPGLTVATQLLTAVTKDGDKSIDILLDVGESLAAMGKGQAELDRIIINLQQIAALGKASTLDIKQFAFAGIPIYEMLAEVTGKTGDALGDFITEGGVTFELLTGMFKEATDEGGRFFGAFEAQGGSFNQLVSNMKDAFGVFMSDLVVSTGLFDLVKRALERLVELTPIWAEKIQKLVEFLKEHKIVIAIVAGALFGALIPAIYAAIVAFGGMLIALAPFMLAGAAIAGVIFGIYWLKENWELVWNFIQEKTHAVVEFLKNSPIGWLFIVPLLMIEKWDVLKGFFQDLWTKVTDIFQKGVDKAMRIIEPFLALVDKVTNAANKVSSKVSGAFSSISSKLSPAGLLGFAEGGIVPGYLGQPQLAMVHGGERIIPNSSSMRGGGSSVNISITGNTFGKEQDMRTLAEMVGREVMRALRASQNI